MTRVVIYLMMHMHAETEGYAAAERHLHGGRVSWEALGFSVSARAPVHTLIHSYVYNERRDTDFAVSQERTRVMLRLLRLEHN